MPQPHLRRLALCATFTSLAAAGACSATTDSSPPQQVGSPAGAGTTTGGGTTSAPTGGGTTPSGGGTSSGGSPTAMAGMPPVSQGGMSPMGGAGPTAGSGAGAPPTAGTSAGGAQGTGGAGGVTSTAGAASGGGGSGGGLPADVIFTDDFESGSPGSQPADWDNFISYNANFTNPNGNVYAVLDTAQVRPGGTQSLHVSGGQDPAQLTRPLPQGTTHAYVRVFVYSQRQLGNITEGNPNHETLIAIRGTPGQVGDEVRFGEIKGVLGTNEVPSDNIAPTMDQWNSGPSASANEWHCWEVAFLGDTAYPEVHAWLDGTEVHSITAATDWQNGELPASWMDGKFVELVIGWQSFSGANNELWFDDLVVAGSRIGCE